MSIELVNNLNPRINFSNIAHFKTLRSCLNPTEIVCESHHVCRFQNLKPFSCSLHRKKFRISLVNNQNRRNKRQNFFSKIANFKMSRRFSNPAKLTIGVVHDMYIQTKKNFRYSLRRKKFVLLLFPYEISKFILSHIAFFQNVKEFFKPNETHSWISSWPLDPKFKKFSDQACVDKKFRSLVVFVRIKRIYFFTYSFFFKTSRNCSNQMKLIVGLPRGI